MPFQIQFINILPRTSAEVQEAPNNEFYLDPTIVPGYSNYLGNPLPPSHESYSSNIYSLGPWEGGKVLPSNTYLCVGAGSTHNYFHFDPTIVPGYSNYLDKPFPPSHESYSSNIYSLGPWEGERGRLHKSSFFPHTHPSHPTHPQSDPTMHLPTLQPFLSSYCMIFCTRL